jgi:MoaA/NifB/PqqE/SkfB family radical SAM enzyme
MSSDIKKRDNFCSIPFLQLQLNPLGNISACCFSGEHTVGNIKDNTLKEIWNGPEMQKWRQEFISGDIKICKGPMKNFECHKMYTHLNDMVDLDVIQTQNPRRLDLRLNGKCNLECVMCDVWSQPNGLYENCDLWTDGPEKIFPYLVEVDMLGGEPFIQKDTFKFIDAVSAVNSQCRWGFITNSSYVFNEKLRSTLDKLELRHIHLSMDGVSKEVYEKIRKKGSFEKTFATIEEYVKYRSERRSKNRDFVLFGSFCVQKDNWHEIGQFLDFCKKREMSPILQSVIGRSHLSLNQLSVAEYDGILQVILPYLNSDLRYAVLPLHEDVVRFKQERQKLDSKVAT